MRRGTTRAKGDLLARTSALEDLVQLGLIKKLRMLRLHRLLRATASRDVRTGSPGPRRKAPRLGRGARERASLMPTSSPVGMCTPAAGTGGA